MDEKELLTVAEYAEKNGVSPQSVYKRVKRGTLKSIVKDGITYIPLNDEADTTPNDNPTQPADNPETTPIQPETTQPNNPNSTDNQPNSTQPNNPQTTPNSTYDIVAFLQEQLKEKDNQIERLQTQIETQAERHQKEIDDLHRLLEQSQVIQAQTIRYLPAGNEEPQRDIEVIEQEQPKEKKKSWWARLFGFED